MAREHSRTTSAPPALTATGHCLFGDSDKVKSICQVVDKVAPHRGPVLLRGESGTGKEVVARAIHMRSPRARRPFVAVNSGAIPQELFESALFGHRKGSFTGALADHAGYFDQADGGTLFLDEIGDLPLMQQVKLLRVLQSGEIQPVGAREPHSVDVRVVAATNRPLERFVESGAFREDLYFRINLFTITLPALRDRTEDITPLAEAFLRRMAAEAGRTDLRWTPAALRILKRYPWPGNIRELENVVQFAVAMAEGATVTADALPQRVRRGEAPFDRGRHHEALHGTTSGGTDGITKLEDVIREHILAVFERCNRNKTHTARALGISLRGLQMRLQRYQVAGLPSGSHRPD
ncbi:MAG TPA: sigma-54 dependent transcriptional regulator [Candidatus Ozemobacteraceae bacterium]|nr:sigma-54 dependent transcriptional regulator [Candidatus Ozemobacteraceae bacterium]